MGAQIAAHLVDAGIPVVLFDLPAKEGDPYGIVRKAIEGLARIDPAPLAAKDASISQTAGSAATFGLLQGSYDASVTIFSVQGTYTF